MAAVTIYNKFVFPEEDKRLMQILDIIKSDQYKPQVTKIRELLSQGKEDEADLLKKSLPGFTPSCRCEKRRISKNITYYTGFIILDIDKISDKEIDRISTLLRNCEYTYGFFISPSGNGLKILIETDGTHQQHTETYIEVAKYFEELLSVKFDPSGKDDVRLCFMSYDPNTYKNLNNKKFKTSQKSDSHPPLWPGSATSTQKFPSGDFEVAVPPSPLERAGVRSAVPPLSTRRGAGGEAISDFELQFLHSIDITSNKLTYENGQRNSFIYLLANNCNRIGIPKAEAEFLIKEKYDLPTKEIEAAIKSAYINHKDDFAKFAHFAKSENDFTNEQLNEQLSKTPTIPEEIFELLPNILKECCKVYSHARQRDVMLTGAIGILSGCLPNVMGVYDGHEIYANLFILIVAPPANDKGGLKYAGKLASDYHMKLLKEYEEALKEYKKEMRLYKIKVRNAKEDPGEEPEPPLQKLHFIPADSSAAKVKRTLKDCDGRGTICETESDTLGITFKQDWGGYSDLFRKAFHHERVTYSRVSSPLIEIETPFLSAILTGTPGQVLTLLQSSENGLVSRILFYTYRSPIKWRDVSPKASNFNLTDHFRKLSWQVTKMIDFFNQQPRINFEMTASQWTKLNERCETLLSKYTILICDDLASSIFRLGVIIFRMAMIFSALRLFENKTKVTTIQGLDQDIDIALTLAECYMQHTALMFQYLPKPVGVKLDSKKIKFLQALPVSFTRLEAVTIGSGIKIAERTVDKYLALFVGVFLTKDEDEYGTYHKMQ